jgi:CheY-like chemotaxis protein
LLTILAVGEDIHLLRTRADVLRKTGANVLCSSGGAALKFIAEWEFDLIVLGHSVRHHDAKQITDAAHRPGSKTLVLLLISDRAREHKYDGIHFDGRSFVEPDCLIRSVSELLGRYEDRRLTGMPRRKTIISSSSSSARKKPASFPADIAARRALLEQFENRRAG